MCWVRGRMVDMSWGRVGSGDEKAGLWGSSPRGKPRMLTKFVFSGQVLTSSF